MCVVTFNDCFPTDIQAPLYTAQWMRGSHRRIMNALRASLKPRPVCALLLYCLQLKGVFHSVAINVGYCPLTLVSNLIAFA